MFIVLSVNEFPAWEPGEAAELDRQNRAYRHWWTRIVGWGDVAAASVAAVTERSGSWQYEE